MIHGFQKGKRAKGQNMVEYALMLAIVVGIGWGIYDQVGLAGSIKGVFSDAGSLLENASKAEKAAFDIKPSIAKLKSLCSNYNLGDGNMNAGDHNTNRGILMDTWLNDAERNDTDIAKLTSELASKGYEYGKPAAEIVGSKSGYSTYAEAQQAYRDAVSANQGSSIFKGNTD